MIRMLLLLSANLVLAAARDFYAHGVTDADGKIIPLDSFKGRVSLVVNVASKCGYTDRTYRDLVELQKKYSPKEFNVLAFPCNQFGGQEPWSTKKIVKKMVEKYGVNFPILAKINVKDDETGYADPAFSNLIYQLGRTPTWNFWKFLVNHHGMVVAAWDQTVPIADFEHEIEIAIKGIALPPAMPLPEDKTRGVESARSDL